MTTGLALALFSAGAVFAAVATLVNVLPRKAVIQARRTRVVALAVSGAGAALTDVALTGQRVWDAVLVCGLLLVAAMAGAIVDRRVLLLVALVPAIGPGTTTSHALGSAAVGAAIAIVALGMRLPPIKAAAAGLTALALLEQAVHGPASASWAAVGIVVLLVATLVRLAPGRRRQAIMIGLVPLVVAGIACGLYLRAAFEARRHINEGVQQARAALDATVGSDPKQAADEFASAAQQFSLANAGLRTWWARAVVIVPGAAQNARALTTMTSVGRDLASAGNDAVAARELVHLSISGGAVNLAAVQSLQLPAARAAQRLEAGQAKLEGARSPFLLPIVDNNLSTLLARLTRADTQTRQVRDTLAVLPGLLGANGPRAYFLAIQNPAESRASGGIIGNFGVITIDHGRYQLSVQGRDDQLNTAGQPAGRQLSGPADYIARYGRFQPQRTWQNVTMSPDFPSVGQVIEQLYPQSGGTPVDGVISVDPQTLAAVLSLIGPVSVARWPVPLSAANVVPVLLHDQYLRLAGDARLQFTSDVVRAVFDRLKAVSLTDPSALARAFGPMFRGKHLLLYSPAAAEERVFTELGAEGGMPPVEGDFLAVTTQNSSGNKIDWYLHRRVEDRVTFDPSTGQVRDTVTITLTNSAPASGLPDYVIGGVGAQPTRPGENRTYLSVYSPLEVQTAELDGRPVTLESQAELGRNVFSTFVTVGPQSTSTITVSLVGSLGPGTRYSLEVRAQPTVNPDDVTATLGLAGGWVVRQPAGNSLPGPGGIWTLPAGQDQSVTVTAQRR